MRIAIRKPSPSSPSRFAAGMRAPSKVSSPVVEPAIPIFGSRRATSNPGVSDLDDERGDAGVPRLGIGLREHGVEARDAPRS